MLPAVALWVERWCESCEAWTPVIVTDARCPRCSRKWQEMVTTAERERKTDAD